MSADPPGGYGTTSATGLLGKPCATAVGAATTAASRAAKVRDNVRMRLMTFLGVSEKRRFSIDIDCSYDLRRVASPRTVLRALAMNACTTGLSLVATYAKTRR